MQTAASWASTLAFLGALVALLLTAAAGPGYRLDAIGLGTAFQLIQWSVFAAGFVIVMAVVWGVTGWLGSHLRDWGTIVISVIIAGAVAFFPLAMRAKAAAVPMIHDISTDTANPPAFAAALAERLADNASNPPEYDAAAAEPTRTFYRDLQSMRFAKPVNEVFAESVRTAEALGWKITQTAVSEGRIEASETSFWFGFTDDVVIRVVQDGELAKVDVRSKSRVGRSDLGANAERIRRFRDALARRLGG